MPTIDIRVPQLGEGLREARLTRFMKQPGEAVARDEPLFEMETDKAVMEIESPAAGSVVSWGASEGDVVPIGAVIGRITTADAAGPEAEHGISQLEEGTSSINAGDGRRENAETGQPATPSSAHTPAPPAPRVGQVPPRTRAYASEKGLSEDELAGIAAGSTGKLLPTDVDRFLADRATAPESAPPRVLSPLLHRDVVLSPAQRTFVFRLERGTQGVIPATMEMRVGWSALEAVRERMRRNGGQRPSHVLLVAWCVAQAIANHPRFRSTLAAEGTLREYEHVNLGVAVARPNDELAMARIDTADAATFEQFSDAYRDAVDRAKAGEDQASDTMQFSVTSMASKGVRMGIPVLVAPAAGVLFVGQPYDEAYPLPGGGVAFRRVATMVLTFDHRIANGAGAAALLSEIRRRIEGLGSERPGSIGPSSIG